MRMCKHMPAASFAMARGALRMEDVHQRTLLGSPCVLACLYLHGLCADGAGSNECSAVLFFAEVVEGGEDLL